MEPGAALQQLMQGLQVALAWHNLAAALAGATLGTLIGVLPGLGPVATMAMLLPTVYAMDVTSALIMLAGIFYGAQYGGSTTSILLNVPGEASSVMTAVDGHAMARRGRAGVALAVAALGSFFAGTVGTAVVALLAAPLAAVALAFGPRENFALLVFGLVSSVVLVRGSLLKGLGVMLLGMLLGQINTDRISGVARYSMGWVELTDGIGVVVVAMGVFGIAEVVLSLDRSSTLGAVAVRQVQAVWPTRQDWAQAWPAVLRGTMVGTLLGLKPGSGPVMASFMAYALEKKCSGGPGEPAFGQGNLRGVAAPEAANNAAAQVSFIPMLTLGIPPGPVMAMMVAAMMIKGIAPGPQVMTANPNLFWGLIASMWVGNLMLLVLNLPLVGLWAGLLRVPYRLLYPAILAFSCIGLYSLNHMGFEVVLGALFGLLGVVLRRLGNDMAPLVLGFVLGAPIEDNLRRSLLLAHGDWSTLWSRPLAAALLGATVVLVLGVAWSRARRTSDRRSEHVD
jgi:putative tricarboxylic transport membrane protein